MSFLNIHSVHHTHITYTNPAIDRKTSRYSTLDTLRILHNLREMEYDPTGRVAVIQQTEQFISTSSSSSFPFSSISFFFSSLISAILASIMSFGSVSWTAFAFKMTISTDCSAMLTVYMSFYPNQSHLQQTRQNQMNALLLR